MHVGLLDINWSSQWNENVFITAAEQMMDLGMVEDDVLILLKDLYDAVADELGEYECKS